MAVADQLDGCQTRCRQQLLRLRMLVLGQDGMALPVQLAAEMREATNVIVAEAEAMSHASFGAAGRPDPGTETFLWVRITRLAVAADKVVDAARNGDVPALRAHLQRLDTLISAIWAVVELHTVVCAVIHRGPLQRGRALEYAFRVVRWRAQTRVLAHCYGEWPPGKTVSI